MRLLHEKPFSEQRYQQAIALAKSAFDDGYVAALMEPDQTDRPKTEGRFDEAEHVSIRPDGHGLARLANLDNRNQLFVTPLQTDTSESSGSFEVPIAGIPEEAKLTEVYWLPQAVLVFDSTRNELWQTPIEHSSIVPPPSTEPWVFKSVNDQVAKIESSQDGKTLFFVQCKMPKTLRERKQPRQFSIFEWASHLGTRFDER